MKTSGWMMMFFALSLALIVEAQQSPGPTTPAPAKEIGSEATDLPVPDLTPGEAKLKASLNSVSGVVNVLRQGERVEAVMKNGDVYQLPRGSRQHEIFKVLQDSEKNGTAVSFTVDSRSNVIQSVGKSSGGGNSDKQK